MLKKYTPLWKCASFIFALCTAGVSIAHAANAEEDPFKNFPANVKQLSNEELMQQVRTLATSLNCESLCEPTADDLHDSTNSLRAKLGDDQHKRTFFLQLRAAFRKKVTNDLETVTKYLEGKKERVSPLPQDASAEQWSAYEAQCTANHLKLTKDYPREIDQQQTLRNYLVELEKLNISPCHTSIGKAAELLPSQP